MIRFLLSAKLGELRINQSELSRKTGISKNKINGLYHELSDSITFEQLDSICDVLNCDVTDLIKRVPDNAHAAKPGHGKKST